LLQSLEFPLDSDTILSVSLSPPSLSIYFKIWLKILINYIYVNV
jgi:hypothetical protein